MDTLWSNAYVRFYTVRQLFISGNTRAAATHIDLVTKITQDVSLGSSQVWSQLLFQYT